VRIIAGRWKGRRIAVPADGVRPTGDRVRETLFNWLTPYLSGARCLDLFAGTGVLGIEALSRGARSAVFVEQNRQAASALSDCLVKLECSSAEVLAADANRIKLADFGPFDVVFLDPPFDGPLIADLCKLLESTGALASKALIYLEMPRQQNLPDLPSGWTTEREKTAGQVRYALVSRTLTGSA
jgi:16S rRNA (guanine966-N2)-methyltransferase